MVHNIYFSVCGEGYGHSSRDMAIAAKLKSAGANVLMGSYGYALDRLKKSFDCIEIEKEFEMPVDLTLKTTMALAEEVLIPDFAPPHTVCLNTLSKSSHVMKKQRFVGPVVSAKYETSQPEPAGIKSPFVLTILSGHSFSLPIFNGILKIADRFPEINFLIFAKFKSEVIF